MHWLILFAAGLCEVGWAVAMKFSHGLTRLGASALTVILLTASMVLLGVAVKSLPLGTAYAIWTGIGIIGTTVFGMLFFGESTSIWRMLAVSLILVGIIGLKLLSPR